MQKVLIVCGPTATGKTAFGVELASHFNGEIVSADSRQVYVGRDLITGKDVTGPSQESSLRWKDRKLKYYSIDGTKIWLYDVVGQGEDFNVSYWKECAEIVIADILSRNKLPIVVGGTGLFIKSLTSPMEKITVPIDAELRKNLENKSVEELFDYLKSIDPAKAASLNESDSKNPRRLIRAMEIINAELVPSSLVPNPYIFLSICLSAPTKFLYSLIDSRVSDRITAGAAAEDPELVSGPQKWMYHEHGLARRQATWFKKQPNLNWFDITDPSWHQKAINLVSSWYNKN